MNLNIEAAYEERYGTMQDEELVERIHNGESEALDYLIQKYRNFVRAKARSYFIIVPTARILSRKA